jgi:hypothetical protein
MKKNSVEQIVLGDLSLLDILNNIYGTSNFFYCKLNARANSIDRWSFSRSIKWHTDYVYGKLFSQIIWGLTDAIGVFANYLGLTKSSKSSRKKYKNNQIFLVLFY